MDVSDRSVRIDPIGKQPEARWTLCCVYPEKSRLWMALVPWLESVVGLVLLGNEIHPPRQGYPIKGLYSWPTNINYCFVFLSGGGSPLVNTILLLQDWLHSGLPVGSSSPFFGICSGKYFPLDQPYFRQLPRLSVPISVYLVCYKDLFCLFLIYLFIYFFFFSIYLGFLTLGKRHQLWIVWCVPK